MTITPSISARAKSMRRRFAVVIVVMAVVVSVCLIAWFVWRPRPPEVPEIRTEGLDKELVAAITKSRDDIKAKPFSAETWGHLGMVLFAHNMYAESEPILKQAEQLDPRDVHWPYLRGLVLVLGKPEQGIASLKRAVELSQEAFSVRLRLAEELLKLGRRNEAESLFRELDAEQPDHARVLLGRGLVFTARQQWKQALQPLQTAAAHPTARRSGRIALVNVLFKLNKKSEAEVMRQQAAKASDDLRWRDPILMEVMALRTGLEPNLEQVDQFLEYGQVKMAGDLSFELVRKYPESAKAHLTQGKVLIRVKSFAKAQDALNRAVRLDPNLVQGHFLLGGTLRMQKDYDAAARSYLRALELKPTHGLAYYNLGECRWQQGDKTKALEAFHSAARYRSDLPATHLKLGEVLLQEGRIDEGISALEDVLRLNSQHPRARELLEQARAAKKKICKNDQRGVFVVSM